MYSELYLNQLRKPEIPKVLFVAIGALLLLVASQAFVWYRNVPAQASTTSLVQHYTLNKSEASASIFFETDIKSRAYVIYGEDKGNLKKSAYHIADTAGKPEPRKYHFIELKNLEQNTTYYYQIISENKIIGGSTGSLSGSEGKYFTIITTLKNLVESSPRKPVYGKLIKPDGTGIPDALVLIKYAISGKTDMWLARSKPSGEWLATVDSGLQDNQIITAHVFHEQYAPSKITAILAKAAPIPQSTVIGVDYQFTAKKGAVLPASTKRSLDNTQSHTVSVLYPQVNALVPNTKPLFRGFGIPGTLVQVRVDSRPVFAVETTVSQSGSWSIEPEQSFIPGKYTTSITLQDNLGERKTITRTFTIAKSGEQVLGEQTISTPSATLNPTGRPSPTLSPGQATTTPGVVFITATPAYIIISNTITPTQLLEGGSPFPLWFMFAGALIVALGAMLVRLGHINQ